MNKKIVGKVVSNSMDKTLVVRVEKLQKHKIYNKYILIHSKFHVHNPLNKDVEIGTIVECEYCRPISKMKNFRLLNVLS